MANITDTDQPDMGEVYDFDVWPRTNGEPHNLTNILDYEDDACMTDFTMDQCVKARNVLRTHPIRRRSIISIDLLPSGHPLTQPIAFRHPIPLQDLYNLPLEQVATTYDLPNSGVNPSPSQTMHLDNISWPLTTTAPSRPLVLSETTVNTSTSTPPSSGVTVSQTNVISQTNVASSSFNTVPTVSHTMPTPHLTNPAISASNNNNNAATSRGPTSFPLVAPAQIKSTVDQSLLTSSTATITGTKTKSGWPSWWWIVLVVGIALVALGAGVFLFMRSRRKRAEFDGMQKFQVSQPNYISTHAMH